MNSEDVIDYFNCHFLEEEDVNGTSWGDCILSPEELAQLLSPPEQDNWLDLDPFDNGTIVSIDSAKSQQWRSGKQEIEHIHKNIRYLLGLGENDDVTESAIIMYTIGADSEIGLLLRHQLGLTRETYLLFMSTFLVQVAYRVSATEMYQSDSLLKHNLLMPEHEYVEVWKRVAIRKKIRPDEIRTTRSPEPLWQQLEAGVNRLLRSISIDQRKGNISIALDDDKIWVNFANSTRDDLFNLKYTTHVKANRKGLIGHTAVSTALNLPLGIIFERTKDSSSSCFKRLLDFLFGRDGSTDLRNVNVHSDRGYLIPSLVFEYLLTNGADVVGTVKRMAQCWPFTFAQVLKPSDKRQLVNVKGAATLYLKYAKTGTKYLFASAFRNGSERVATAISTLHSAHHWEGTALKPVELELYKRDSSALRSMFFCKVDDLNAIQRKDLHLPEVRAVIENLFECIEPLTLRQGTADWHYLRKFSLTSSQAHMAFIKAFPAHKDNISWVEVARYLYGNNWKNKLNVDQVVSNQTATNDNAQVTTSAEGADDSTTHTFSNTLVTYLYNMTPREDDHALAAALNILKTYVGYPDANIDNGIAPLREHVIESQEDANKIIGDLSNPVRQAMIKLLLGHVKEEHRKPKISKLELTSWLMSPNVRREFLFYNTEGLKACMRDRNLQFASGRYTNNRMVDALSGTDNSGIGTCSDSNNTEDALASGVFSPTNAATKAILEKSFLPHMKGISREYCSLGHRLEKPILSSWINTVGEENRDGPTYGFHFEIEAAFTAGLAAKKDAIYAKDSIDFVLIVKDNGVLKPWGFEAKGRVTSRTEAEERHQLRLQCTPHVRINENEVHMMVMNDGERFQLIQHAYVYDFDTVVHAVSDGQSNLIRSTVIDFTVTFKHHFGKVLEDLFHDSLSWAYPPPSRMPLNHLEVIKVPDHIQNIGNTIATINGKETLQGTFNLWCSLMKLPKPLPSLERLIPAIYAFWNVVKGGSDTTTKLMDDCITKIPKVHINAESVACARCIMLVSVLNHRLMQIFSTRDYKTFTSLAHYRNAASHRTTMHSSLLKISKLLKIEYMKCNTAANEELKNHTTGAQQQNDVNDENCNTFEGIIPQEINFGAVLTTKTPYKLTKRVMNGSATTEIIDMLKNCTGIPIMAYPNKPTSCQRHDCNNKTNWYCKGCKRWLCLNKNKSRTTNNQNKSKLYQTKVRGKNVTFLKSCFHEEHENAWCQLIETRPNNLLTTPNEHLWE